MLVQWNLRKGTKAFLPRLGAPLQVGENPFPLDPSRQTIILLPSGIYLAAFPCAGGLMVVKVLGTDGVMKVLDIDDDEDVGC